MPKLVETIRLPYAPARAFVPPAGHHCVKTDVGQCVQVQVYEDDPEHAPLSVVETSPSDEQPTPAAPESVETKDTDILDLGADEAADTKVEPVVEKKPKRTRPK